MRTKPSPCPRPSKREGKAIKRLRAKLAGFNALAELDKRGFQRRIAELETGLKNWTDYGNKLKAAIRAHAGDGDPEVMLLAMSKRLIAAQAENITLQQALNRNLELTSRFTGNFPPQTVETKEVRS